MPSFLTFLQLFLKQKLDSDVILLIQKKKE